MKVKKGIMLAAGRGSRQGENTRSISKPLLSCYDQPTACHPLSYLITAGIKEVLIIVSRRPLTQYQNQFGYGERFGIKIEYAIQEKPEGIAQAFIIGEDFIGDDPVALTFGDNIFVGDSFNQMLIDLPELQGATIFAKEVVDPKKFGVVEFDSDGKAISIEEKPKYPRSNFAVVGLYFFDNDVVKIAKSVKKSDRGEYEITSVIDDYLKRGDLRVLPIKKDVRWFDTGNPEQLFQAASHVRQVQNERNTTIGSPYIAAYRRSLIETEQLKSIARSKVLAKSVYGSRLLGVIDM